MLCPRTNPKRGPLPAPVRTEERARRLAVQREGSLHDGTGRIPRFPPPCHPSRGLRGGGAGCSRSLRPVPSATDGTPTMAGSFELSCTWPSLGFAYALRQSQGPASTAAMKVEGIAKQRLHPETVEALREVHGATHPNKAPRAAPSRPCTEHVAVRRTALTPITSSTPTVARTRPRSCSSPSAHDAAPRPSPHPAHRDTTEFYMKCPCEIWI